MRPICALCRRPGRNRGRVASGRSIGACNDMVSARLGRCMIPLANPFPVRASAANWCQSATTASQVASKLPSAVLAIPRVKCLLSQNHISVDGTLIQAWASMKSFKKRRHSARPFRALRGWPRCRGGFPVLWSSHMQPFATCPTTNATTRRMTETDDGYYSMISILLAKASRAVRGG